MAAIRTLLNPAGEDGTGHDSNEDSKNELSGHDSQISANSGTAGYPGGFDSQLRKKQKICKDNAVFKPGSIRGVCRYPPYEDQDDLLAAKHQMYEVYPIGKIAAYPRHIPYNSEKKLFLEKTGRDSFEVFQYQFKIPGDAHTYNMLWDYNIGLVRTTPLFKCGNYSKTTPAKMLSRNPGLKDLCHSITGGALVAQGYWIPYDAARAVAATFCWHIRYALTPVFGNDFPEICLPPASEEFGSMQIDPEITKECAMLAEEFRELEIHRHTTPNSSCGIQGPQLPLHQKTHKARPQLKRILPKSNNKEEGGSTSEYSATESGDPEDRYELSSPSPQIAFTNPWSAVNTTPRSPSPKISFTNPWSSSPASTTRSASPQGNSRKGRPLTNIPRSHTPLDLLPPPRKPMFSPSTTITINGTPTTRAEPLTQPASIKQVFPRTEGGHMDIDEDYDAGSSEDSEDARMSDDNIPVSAGRKKSSRGVFTETKAAYVLMKLKTQQGVFEASANSLKRRASA